MFQYSLPQLLDANELAIVATAAAACFFLIFAARSRSSRRKRARKIAEMERMQTI